MRTLLNIQGRTVVLWPLGGTRNISEFSIGKIQILGFCVTIKFQTYFKKENWLGGAILPVCIRKKYLVFVVNVFYSIFTQMFHNKLLRRIIEHKIVAFIRNTM